MIISRTPFRVSFFGGGTDYPVWFRQHPGAVLATTIDKYCYISCRYLPPFFEHKHRVVWSRIEHVDELDDIQHPAVREALKWLNIREGIEIHHVGDLPALSGMGSSSAFTVGLLHVLNALRGTLSSRQQLAQDAIYIEQQLLKEHVGCQDQVLASHGGFNRIDFEGEASIRVTPITLPQARMGELQRHLLLFFTGLSRTASDVAEEQVKSLGRHMQELQAMYHMVSEGVSILTAGRDLSAFGRLLHESWMLKRSLTSRISTSYIDQLYASACSAGAVGGKLLGAGGGGFILVFARPEDHRRIKAKLRGLLHVPFEFEPSGSQIIFYEQDGYGFGNRLYHRVRRGHGQAYARQSA